MIGVQQMLSLSRQGFNTAFSELMWAKFPWTGVQDGLTSSFLVFLFRSSQLPGRCIPQDQADLGGGTAAAWSAPPPSGRFHAYCNHQRGSTEAGERGWSSFPSIQQDSKTPCCPALRITPAWQVREWWTLLAAPFLHFLAVLL